MARQIDPNHAFFGSGWLARAWRTTGTRRHVAVDAGSIEGAFSEGVDVNLDVSFEIESLKEQTSAG